MEQDFHPRKWPVEEPFHCPTNGSPCEPPEVDSRSILATNLRALMDHAKDHRHPDLGTLLGIERATGEVVKRATLRGILAGTVNVQLETIEAVAAAFEIQAWTLLIPHLDPSNPPVKPISKTEQQLYKRLGKVARDYERLQRELREADTTRTTGADNNPEGPVRDGAG